MEPPKWNQLWTHVADLTRLSGVFEIRRTQNHKTAVTLHLKPKCNKSDHFLQRSAHLQAFQKSGIHKKNRKQEMLQTCFKNKWIHPWVRVEIWATFKENPCNRQGKKKWEKKGFQLKKAGEEEAHQDYFQFSKCKFKTGAFSFLFFFFLSSACSNSRVIFYVDDRKVLVSHRSGTHTHTHSCASLSVNNKGSAKW